MKVIQFLLYKDNTYIELKKLIDLSMIQGDGVSYIDSDTNESIKSEFHQIYIISFENNFRKVAYGYTKKHNLKLFEAYATCIEYLFTISENSFRELILPIYKDHNQKKIQEGFLLSKEFKGCYVFGLDYHLEKRKKKKWIFNKSIDDFVFRKIDNFELMKN